MNQPFDGAIQELKLQRQKIDTAIEALEMLGGTSAPTAQPTDGSTAKPKGAKTRRGAAKKPEVGSTRDLVMGELQSGPKRRAQIVVALKNCLRPSQVDQMLNYLKAHDFIQKNADLTFSLTGKEDA